MVNIFSFVINYVFQDIFKQRTRPRVLQMPITSKCNSRCVTCNIWKDKSDKIEMNADALKKILQDPFFSKVHTVGLNGGEPSLYSDIELLLDALFTLKCIKRIHFISNALITHRLLEMMEKAKRRCSERNICLYLTVSIDGVEDVHNTIRGLPTAFSKTMDTLGELKADQKKYCDVLDIGCTLSKDNVEYVIQTQSFIDSLGIPAYYHPAVPNKRLHNFGQQDFNIMNTDRFRMLATEYFFGKFKYGKGLRTRLRSFLTYYYLLNRGKERLAGCNYLRSDVTITENLDLCLCATASDIVGNLRESSATDLLRAGKLKKEELKVQHYCQGCVHYIIFPSMKGSILFLKELAKPFVWIQYKLLSIW